MSITAKERRYVSAGIFREGSNNWREDAELLASQTTCSDADSVGTFPMTGVSPSVEELAGPSGQEPSEAIMGLTLTSNASIEAPASTTIASTFLPHQLEKLEAASSQTSSLQAVKEFTPLLPLKKWKAHAKLLLKRAEDDKNHSQNLDHTSMAREKTQEPSDANKKKTVIWMGVKQRIADRIKRTKPKKQKKAYYPVI